MNQRPQISLAMKSTIEEIRERFDSDVERFSNLDTGQVATIDAPLSMELITRAAIASSSPIGRVLDVGCGAGNNTIKLWREYGSDFEIDLLDLSEPMLIRAEERLRGEGANRITRWHSDLRKAALPEESYDVVLAAAVLHHLRDDSDWERAFTKLHRILRPNGSIWITDLVVHESGGVQEMMWQRYGEYLSAVGGDEYRDRVFAYIEKEDSPRPVTYQLELLRRVGFERVELLHKNSCFAAFGAVKLR